MFAKLSGKLDSKLERFLPGGGSSSPQAAVQHSATGGGSEQLGTGSKRELFRYRYWRGVNLGSWFSLEKWITRQPFDNAKNDGDADYDICASSRPADETRRMLEAHWDSWVTAADFAWLASRGVNTVRLPISYYHLVGLDPSLLAGTEFEPFAPIYAGAWERIQRAFALADQHGLGVLVDLHAVPGKQNADAHAGVSHHGPLLFDKSKYQDQTVRVLEALVGAVCQVENVVGVEIMNEPKQHAKLAGFHKDTLARLRRICGPDFPLIVGDSWDLGGGLKTYFPDQNFTVLDTHVYRCFTPEDGRTPAEQHAHNMREGFAAEMGKDDQLKVDRAGGRVIVGEWSGALNPGSMGGSHGGEADAKTRAFVRAELEVFDKTTSGFFYWTLKKQDGWDAGWSFKNACQAEIVPAFLGQRAAGGKQADWNGAVGPARDHALGSHSSYWDHTMGPKAAKMEHDRFGAGFTTGWFDQLMFLNSGFTHPHTSASTLPQAGGQWKVRRAREHVAQRGRTEWVWEWEQGFDQGWAAATDFWNRA